jgi:hypothetical protein
MQSIQTDTLNDTALISHDEALPVTSDGSYQQVRFNATKHGILSRLVVLAHENHAEFDELLAALIDEHRPAGMTERHLIEELASIIWRKRRVLLAEGAKINEGLKTAVNSPKLVMSAAAPFQHGLSGENVDLRDLLDATPSEIAERLRDAALDLAATQSAAAILHKGAASAYQKARRALIPDSREWWDSYVAEEEYPESAEGLAEFISEKLQPLCYRLLQEAELTPAIKAQILGEGMQAHRLEKLNRYETHLDRKFERTLAMLLKLKDLRSA